MATYEAVMIIVPPIPTKTWEQTRIAVVGQVIKR
jgi:hypothetical protein